MRLGNSTICQLFGALLCLPALAAPAHAGTGTGTVAASLLPPFSLVRTADLDFGVLVPTAAGTATINAQTGVLTPTGVIPAGGTVSRGLFTGTGTPGRVVTLSLSPLPSITITRTLGPQTMTINQVRVSVDGGSPQPIGPNHTIGATGIITIAVGGRLNVAAAQTPGSYRGIFTITMNYQ